MKIVKLDINIQVAVAQLVLLERIQLVKKQQVVLLVQLEHILLLVQEVVQLALMVNIQKEEFHHVQHVQRIVMVIVIRKQVYVFHVKQDLVLKMEFVHNVQLENMQLQMER